jgi:phosphoserine phosphatase
MCSADSPGRSTLKTDAVLIFDLDGTVLSVNSFPYWALYMLTGHFAGLGKKERLRLSFRTFAILLKRKILRHSHYRTKYLLQGLWTESVKNDTNQVAMHAVITILQNYVRPNLQTLLAAVKAGEIDALLATSAAGEYAQALGKTLGFQHILTTPLCTEADKRENCKVQKRDRALALLEELGWRNRPRILFTDHAEDLPLIQECQRTLWFGRYEELAAIQAQAPKTRVVFGRTAPETEILRLAGCQ